jgi:3-methyladenine DNA glycosylase AlkD
MALKKVPGTRAAEMRRAPTLAALKREFTRAADPERVRTLTWFKTGKGEYGEHDRFIGVSVPMLRAIAARYHQLKLTEIEALLASRIHEHRFAGLLILVAWYEDGDAGTRLKVFDFYLNHRKRVNNWDLVDASAPYIVGEHLVSRSRRVLYHLADSCELWDRRIAMVATSAFIQRGDLKDTFAIAKRLLDDKHDLIHKAIGWMLREAGEYSRAEMIDFLKRNYSQMPRTALRYAIEHLPEVQRKSALRGIFRL